MFNFDKDDDFDLMDLVEADIKYGLFDEDEKEQEKLKQEKNSSETTSIDERINKALDKHSAIFAKGSYSEKALFRSYCRLANLYEEKFQIVKIKFLKEYHRLYKYYQRHTDDFVDIDTFDLEMLYDEMEDCLSIFDDIADYEYEDGFEDVAENYAQKKDELEDELSECEEIKDAAIYEIFDVEPVAISKSVKTLKERSCNSKRQNSIPEQKQTPIIPEKIEEKNITPQITHKEKETEIIEKTNEIQKTNAARSISKPFKDWDTDDKIRYIVSMILILFAIVALVMSLPFIFEGTGVIFEFIWAAVVAILKSIWKVLEFLLALIFLPIFLLIVYFISKLVR